MSERSIIGKQSVPRLAPHMRLRFDDARESWTIQAPERSFLLDQVAHAIVSRCDGIASVGAIVDSLCVMVPDAPRDMIERDVTVLIQNFIDKSVMVQ